MSFVDPNTIHNPATGTVAPASWGDQIRDDLVFLSARPRAQVSHNTTQSHGGGWVAASANTEAVDTDAMHSTSVNTSRLTIVTPGTYWFEAVLEFAANTTGVRAAKLLKNGTTDYMGTLFPASTTARPMVVGMIPGLVAGDYVEVAGFQNSGGALNMQLLRFSGLWVATS